MTMKKIFQNSAFHTLAIDVSWMANRHKHSLGQVFTTSRGRMSGHVYGSFKNVASLLATFEPQHVVFCYDRGYSWRTDLVPTYKQKRRAKQGTSGNPFSDEVTEGVTYDVERLLRNFPGEHLALDDYEADDMMAWVAARSKAQGKSLAIYSRDHDLWQLVSDRDKVSCLEPAQKSELRSRIKAVYVREAQVKEAFGVEPRHLSAFKALAGDTSDELKGLCGGRRSGKKGALLEFAPKSETYFSPSTDLTVDRLMLDTGTPEWLAKPLIEEREQMLRNYQIVDLEHARETMGQKVQPDMRPTPNTEGMLNVLEEFECVSLFDEVRKLAA